MVTEEIVLREVQEKLRQWNDGAPSRNWTELGRRAKLGEHIIRRIVNDNALPQPTNLLAIMGAMIGSNKISDLRKNYSEQVISYLKFRLPMLDFERHEPSAVENFGPNEMLDIDRTLFEVYLFIATLESTSRTELMQEFGSCANKWVNLLIDRNLVYETLDNQVYPKQKNIALSKSKSEIKRMNLAILESRYKPSAENNLIAFFADPVNEEGLLKMRSAISDLFGTLEKIATEHPGKIPVVTGLFCDILQETKRPTSAQKENANEK